MLLGDWQTVGNQLCCQCSNIDEEYLQNPEEQTEAVIIDVETQLYETKQVADAETQVETLSKSIQALKHWQYGNQKKCSINYSIYRSVW